MEIIFGDAHAFSQWSHTTAALQSARRKADRYTFYKVFLELGRTTTNIKQATGRESRFLIDTPSALCAARGTMFRASVDQTTTTRSEVLKGLLAVEAMGEQVKLPEGEGTVVKKGDPPLRPRKLLPPPEALSLQELRGGAAQTRALASEELMGEIVNKIAEEAFVWQRPIAWIRINIGYMLVEITDLAKQGESVTDIEDLLSKFNDKFAIFSQAELSVFMAAREAEVDKSLVPNLNSP